MTRISAVVFGIAAVVLSAADYRHVSLGQKEALGLIDEYRLEARNPNLRAEVRRRYDPVEARARVARALLNQELDRSWMADLEEAELGTELARGQERLERARSIARAAWAARPASWEAAMVLGGATYLGLSRDRDPRLMVEADLWEGPLLAAHRLGPSEPGPVRFLAAAYLGNWSSLTPERRDAAASLLALGFRDQQTFQLLIRDWLRVAPSRHRALELVPDEPWAWQILQEAFSAAADWELYAATRQRWYEALERDVETTLSTVESQLAQGELVDTRNLLLRLAQRLPRSFDFAPPFQRLLELLPPGPPGNETAEVFARWLDWAFELCLLGECPFDPSALSRLGRLSGDVEPHRRAMAFLLSGDVPRAELLERRFATGGGSEWAAYHVLKAEHLGAAGASLQARQMLDRVPMTWRNRPVYWTTAREIAQLSGDGDLEARSAAELDTLRRESWPASSWSADERGWALTLLPSHAASGLALEIVGAPRSGAVAEVYWDERLLGIRRVATASDVLRFELEISGTPHRLSVRIQASGPVRPAGVQLL